MTLHVAVDLGASSGRVTTARVSRDDIQLEEVHRFVNTPVRLPDGLHWDVLRLHRGVLDGLANAAHESAAQGERIETFGIDSWAVDYGLLDSSGALLGNPYHYRDGRTATVVDEVHARMSPAELYAVNGLQYLPFNTLYQIAAAARSPQFKLARTLLLIPDLLAYFLTGETGAERTNASTTGLLDVGSGGWSPPVCAAAGIPDGLLPPLRYPGEIIGRLTPQVLDETGLPASSTLMTVGSHDTASAVVAVPATGDGWAYISSGTWSLVGVELDRPVLSEASRTANFTNEGGVDGTVRYLRNVMGLWLLQESLRSWKQAGLTADLPTLISAAAQLPHGGAVIDVDDEVLLPPGDMPQRIAEACRLSGQPPPEGQAQTVRCVLDSLAAAYARTLGQASELSGRSIKVVHVVGGGARNELLCQLTADACGLPVLAGPVEATALGNALVQSRACGTVRGDLPSLRALLATTQELIRYEPRPTLGRRQVRPVEYRP